MKASLRSKDKASLPCCQASGREVRIIHHHEREYQRLEEDFSRPGGIVAEVFYNGTSQAQAERAFSRAALVGPK
jgi:hypothetical protein